MYIVSVARIERRKSLGAVVRSLTAWYAVRKWYDVSDSIEYYFVADDESFEIFTKILQASGYRVERKEKLESIPWYLENIYRKFLTHAERLRFKRKALEILKPVSRGETTVEEVAKKHGIDYGKLKKIKDTLSKALFVEFFPRASYEELMTHAVRVGLVPITESIYYSSSFKTRRSKYEEILNRVIGLPLDEFRRRLKEIVESRYGLDADKVYKRILASESYRRAITEAKVNEIKKYVKLEYNVFTPL